jgi:hypothetical protein
VFINPFDPTLAIVEAVSHTKDVFSHCGRDHVHGAPSVEVLDGDDEGSPSLPSVGHADLA